MGGGGAAALYFMPHCPGSVYGAVLAPLAAMLCVFVFLTQAFRTVARELKRVDNLSRGPLVSHVTATAAGLTTVTAFGAAPRFTALNAALVDAQRSGVGCDVDTDLLSAAEILIDQLNVDARH